MHEVLRFGGYQVPSDSQVYMAVDSVSNLAGAVKNENSAGGSEDSG